MRGLLVFVALTALTACSSEGSGPFMLDQDPLLWVEAIAPNHVPQPPHP